MKFHLDGRWARSAWLAMAAVVVFAAGCGRRVAKVEVGSEKALFAGGEAEPDSGLAGGSGIVTELRGGKFKKTMPYPYLTVRFKQNDTDVEMVLDPLSTNMTLDLSRAGIKNVEVFKGDSSLTASHPVADSLLSRRLQGQEFADLTDEIVGDINLAQALFYQRKYDAALKVLQASLQKKQTAAAYALGGSIYFVNGEIDEAVRAWQNALAINPNLDDIKRLVARYQTE